MAIFNQSRSRRRCCIAYNSGMLAASKTDRRRLERRRARRRARSSLCTRCANSCRTGRPLRAAITSRGETPCKRRSFYESLLESNDDAFGNQITETDPTVDTIFGFAGREWDESSDLYFNRARYYDPSLGQFISQDPIGFEAGDPNLYRYVGNGPTNATDPSGLDEAGVENRSLFGRIVDTVSSYVDPQNKIGLRLIPQAKTTATSAASAITNAVRDPDPDPYDRTATKRDYNFYREQGLSTYAAIQLAANPVVGALEAYDGTSFQPEDFGDQLGIGQRAVRGASSAIATTEVAALPVAISGSVGRNALSRSFSSSRPAASSFTIDVAQGGSRLAPIRGAQGLTRSQFGELGTAVRGGAGHISDDIFVHRSRASGTARAASDIDIAVRVGPGKFDNLIRSRFGTPNPGSAKERTMLHAIQTGKIHSGEAGLRGLRKQLEKSLGFDVDISVIRRGGPFDQGPRIPLGGG